MLESFLPNTSYPQLSSLVVVAYDEKRGRHVKAVQDIPPGTVVGYERGTVISIDPQKCAYCLKTADKDRNRCLECSKKALPQQLDRYESDFSEELDQLGLAKLAIRLILSYPVEQMLKCLEGESNRDDVTHLDRDDFRSIMGLKCGESMDLSMMDGLLDSFHRSLRSHPSWRSLPLSTFRSLFHEICSKLPLNAHTIYSVDKQMRRSDFLPCGVGLFPISSLFNHSCRANVFSFFYHDHFIFVSKGVRKGEELVDNYGVQAAGSTKEERQAFLRGRGFNCHCTACTGEIEDVGERFTRLPATYQSPSPSIPSIRLLMTSSILPPGHREYQQLIDNIDWHKLDLDDAFFCFETVLEGQRRRGMLLEPEQVVLYLKILSVGARNIHSPFMLNRMGGWLASCMMRIRLFYRNLHPAYDVISPLWDAYRSGSVDEKDEMTRRLKPLLDNLVASVDRY